MLWTEKYRPETLESIVGNNQVKSTLLNLISKNQLPHLLLYGGPGVGKTTTIRALITSMFGKSHGLMDNVLELNASDDRTIKTVREDISDFVSSSTIRNTANGWDQLIRSKNNQTENQHINSSLKLVVLEEVDSFIYDAQFCLRGLLELYSDHARFLMTCNNVHALLPALRSRCCEFYFRPLNPEDLKTHLEIILRREGIDMHRDHLQKIIHFADGDLRKAISKLQSQLLAQSSLPARLPQLDGDKDTVAFSNHDVHSKIRNSSSDMDAFIALGNFKEIHDLDTVELLREISYLADLSLPIQQIRQEGEHLTQNSFSLIMNALIHMSDRGLSQTICMAILSVYLRDYFV